MAIAFDSASSGLGTSGGTSFTYSHTVSSNTDGVLTVIPGWWGFTGRSVTGITYATVALTQIASAFVHNNYASILDIALDIWYLKAPSTGANNVVITTDLGVVEFLCGSTAWTGVDQTTSVGTANTNTGTSTSATVAISSNSGDVIIGASIWDDTNAGNVSSSDTQRFEVYDGGFGDNNVINGSSSTVEDNTMTWSNSASRAWACTAVALRIVSAGGGFFARQYYDRHIGGQ